MTIATVFILATLTQDGAVTRGRITLKGDAPKPAKVECRCAAGVETIDESLLVDKKTKGVRDVFVWVTNPPPGKHAAPAEPVTIESAGGNFAPRVAGVVAGQKIVFVNRDPHCVSVHGLPRATKEWNWCLQPGNECEIVPERLEMEIAVKSDIEPWMRATVHVMEHPYFAVTNGEGAFELPPLPPGEYTVEAWHEKLGKLAPRVVKAGARFAMEYERK
jgi:hypothetical protein